MPKEPGQMSFDEWKNLSLKGDVPIGPYEANAYLPPWMWQFQEFIMEHIMKSYNLKGKPQPITFFHMNTPVGSYKIMVIPENYKIF